MRDMKLRDMKMRHKTAGVENARHITAGHKFCCSLSNAKISFYRAFNCIFDKVGRVAHEIYVVIELLKAKCLPNLYYGLEACPINKSQIMSLNFVLNSAFRKIFVIKSQDVANECIWRYI